MSWSGETLVNPRSQEMWSYWQSLNGGQMPPAAAWDPIRVPKVMPWCTIIERGGATGFRLRFTRPCGRYFTVEARSDTGRNCLFETLSLPLGDEAGMGFRLVNHFAILEELPYGEAQTNFAKPAFAHWIDLGAGVPTEL